MIRFKHFVSEARDASETLHHLHKLANHPNTAPHERDAALRAIERIKGAHNPFHKADSPPPKHDTDTGYNDAVRNKTWQYHKQTYGVNGSRKKGFIYRKQGEYFTMHHSVGNRYETHKHKSHNDAHMHMTKNGFEPGE